MFSPRKQPSTSVEQEEGLTATTSKTPLYHYTFFAKEAAAARKTLVPGLILPVFYNVLLLWVCLSLYFGSLLKSNDISRIHVAAININDGPFGAALIAAIKYSPDGQGLHLKGTFADPSTVNAQTWSKSMVLEEHVWAVLEIFPNASSHLHTALETGNAS
jgi:hypothetical protein